MRKINVLSLADGISTGQVALRRVGIDYGWYFASEIDPYCIKVAKHHFPATFQIGDLTKVDANKLFAIPDLIISGTPCQSFSNAGDGTGFKGKSGLFWEFVRVLMQVKKINPDVKFLFENVPMKKIWRDAISVALGVRPIMIDAALVSAQSRPRWFWTNIEGITQPEDRGILLKDILEIDVPTSYWHTYDALKYMNRKSNNGKDHWGHASDSAKDKSVCVTAVFHKGVPYNVLIDRDKSYAITGTYNNAHPSDYLERRKRQHIMTYDGLIRKLTPTECCRLQSMPDDYLDVPGISLTQKYKMIGNGWNADVIAHILSFYKVTLQDEKD